MRTLATAVLAFLLGFGTEALWSQTTSSTKQAVPAQSLKSTPADGPSKIDPAKEADIRRLLDIAGTRAIATQTLDEMTITIKPLLAGTLPPGEYRQKLVELFFAKFKSKADAQHIVDLAVPIYDKHFSREEINGLIQFYQTPLGKKTLTELPLLFTELRQAGEKWGQALGRESMMEVLAEHPDMEQALKAASQSSPQ